METLLPRHLPDVRLIVGRLLPIVLWTGMAALFSQWLDFRGWESGFETAVKDTLLVWTPLFPQADPALAIIDIDQATYEACFEPPQRLTPETVVGMIKSLPLRGQPPVTILGVDLLTDATDYARHELSTELPQFVFATGGSPRTESETFGEWFRGNTSTYFVRPTGILGRPFQEARRVFSWGVPTYPADDDGVLRRVPFTARFTTEVDDVPTFAAAVADKYRPAVAERSDEAYMLFGDWSPKANLLKLSALELFSCAQKPQSTADSSSTARIGYDVVPNQDGIKKLNSFRDGAGGKVIVLLGASYEEAGDRRQTPRGPMSGLELNAYAIRSALNGNGVRELAPWVMFLVEWFGACLILGPSRFAKTKAQQHRVELIARSLGFVSFVVIGGLLHSVRSMWPGVIWALDYVWDYLRDRTPLAGRS